MLAFFGHHKCASTWAYSIIGTLCDDAGWSSEYLTGPRMFDGDLARWLQGHPTDFLCYVNADWQQVEPLVGRYRGFHIIRDPRDLLVSAYFSHLHTHKTHAWPELVDHRKRLQSADIEEGLMLEMDFNDTVFQEMRTWNYDQDDVLEVRMEELTVDPLNQWLAIFRHLQVIDEGQFGKKQAGSFFVRSCLNVLSRSTRLPVGRRLERLPAERIFGVVHDQRFERQAKGRKAGDENIKSHYRKGVAGDWANHFSERHVEVFKERYNDLLLQLGYVESADWGLELAAV